VVSWIRLQSSILLRHYLQLRLVLYSYSAGDVLYGPQQAPTGTDRFLPSERGPLCSAVKCPPEALDSGDVGHDGPEEGGGGGEGGDQHGEGGMAEGVAHQPGHLRLRGLSLKRHVGSSPIYRTQLVCTVLFL
jgi:hypothetical protein